MGLLEQGRALAPHAAFVFMTAFGSISTAVEAMKRGAENYLTKPLDLDAVSAVVTRATEKAQLSREAASLRGRLDRRFSMHGILGEHPAMQRMINAIEQRMAKAA
jgi:DNA-binding NtrC family response regulator